MDIREFNTRLKELNIKMNLNLLESFNTKMINDLINSINNIYQEENENKAIELLLFWEKEVDRIIEFYKFSDEVDSLVNNMEDYQIYDSNRISIIKNDLFNIYRREGYKAAKNYFDSCINSINEAIANIESHRENFG